MSLLRRSLALRLLLSYLLVIVVGVAVLASASTLSVPTAFERHMSMMSRMMNGDGALFRSFETGVREALLASTLASVLAAVTVSVLISRRVVAPVRQMMDASRRIAAGHYDERVAVPTGAAPEDLDELGQLAIAFNQMASTLERTEAIRRELIADVAHELRTPLASIRGYMEGLIDGVVPAEPDTYLRLQQETERLQRLVQDLQELSRVEAGGFELRRAPADVAALLTEAAARLWPQFEAKGVELAVEPAAGLPPVPLDHDRVLQVLLNLLANALRYTPAGGSVHLTARHVGTEVAVSVADTGIGIAPEHLQRIFTRFYRVDRSRSRASGGTGIGLTIAKHLVEAHGGRIWAESGGPGRGSTFTFTLPL